MMRCTGGLDENGFTILTWDYTVGKRNEEYRKVTFEEATEEELCAVVRIYPDTLRFIPESRLTSKILISASRHWSANIFDLVDHKYISPDTVTKLVKEQGVRFFKKVPRSFITKQLCESAVKRSGQSIYYVPLEFLTDDLMMRAVKQAGDALRFIPREKWTPELMLAAVKSDGISIQHIPLELRNEELALAAVNCDGTR